MQFQEATFKIAEVCETYAANEFTAKSEEVESAVNECTFEEILEHLDNAGIIPECFDHDSTEEKVFAKYCDALLARALRELGLDSKLIKERADAADVDAAGNDYRVVGDAKAFRLSRSAKNQKDFKIEALNSWRKGAEYSCLVGPLNQFPQRSSQIYLQAIKYNVTILSYLHLAFLLRNKPENIESLKDLWEFTGRMKESKSADVYWRNLDQVILRISGKKHADLQNAYDEARERLPKQAEEQVAYWKDYKNKLKDLPKEKLQSELIKALKIDAKIAVIRNAARI